MSETDSFLEEVTEEVRRDKMIKTMRRNAPFLIGAVVLLIGGIGVNEYLKASARAEAEATGDAMMAALTAEDAADRAAGLQALVAEGGDAEVLARMQLAAVQAREGDREAAIDTLRAVQGGSGVDTRYADIAAMKIAMLLQGQDTVAERRALLENLSLAGHPLQDLALEQMAALALEQGDTEAALADLTRIVESPTASSSGRSRATQLIIALGGELPEQETGADLLPTDG
ncbi:tetratricopeptide repeat protein [Algicella marina]|uniref:tetratricopeptide repeat protein n=1 Tax=Algicella marina TaxID=2683284 RepID=UPI001379F945|nr:tetratricopeptide repeat protein [Algicella marina]